MRGFISLSSQFDNQHYKQGNMQFAGNKRRQPSDGITRQRKIQHIMSSLPERMETNHGKKLKSSTGASSSPSFSSSCSSLHDHLVSIVVAKGVKIKVQSYDSMNDFFCCPTPEEIEAYKHDVLTAVRQRDLKTLRSFHEEGRTLKCSNKFGESLLHLACRKGLVDVANFLVNEAGVPLCIRDDYGRSPLHDACWNISPNFELVDLIIGKCPDLLYISDRRGHTPLSYVRKEHWGIWQVYLNKKVDFLSPKTIGYAKS